MIDQAYDKLRGQEQNVADLNTVIEGARGATGSSHAPKPKLAKIDDTLKPKGKLGGVHNLRLQMEVGRWSAKCK